MSEKEHHKPNQDEKIHPRIENPKSDHEEFANKSEENKKERGENSAVSDKLFIYLKKFRSLHKIENRRKFEEERKETTPLTRIKPLLKTERLLIQRTRMSDARALYDQLNQKEILDNLSASFENYEEWANFLRYVDIQWNLKKNFSYTIKEQGESETIVGQISLYDISFPHKRVELGIWIGKQYQRKGYAFEVLSEIMNYIFTFLQMNRIQVHILTSNTPSINLFEKLGFRREGKLTQFILRENDFMDVYLYAITKEEWKKRKANINSE